MKRTLVATTLMALALSTSVPAAETPAPPAAARLPYPIVGTGQTKCYDSSREIPAPKPGQPFYGQDAQHPGPAPAYKDNGDGTVADLVTGLEWVKARGGKMTWDDAVAGAAKCRAGGHDDWRMPGIKELYSLIDFTGGFHRTAAESVPYLDAKAFEFRYGDEANGERGIDCQDWSATEYLGTTMSGNATVFGVNFADGRIKGYPKFRPGPGGKSPGKMYVRYVRGNPNYGKNDFLDNGDGTIADRATGLEWSKADSGKGLNWEAALAWVQARNAEKHLGHADWRLPNAKELQSIVDYSRAPAAAKAEQRGPAIDPKFGITRLEDGEYPFFWTGTTHLDGPADVRGRSAIYVCFGRALGYMRGGGPGGPGGPGEGEYRLLDVHGAGAQRSDPKAGNPADFPHGRGPQGDVIRIGNFVRLVRDTAKQ